MAFRTTTVYRNSDGTAAEVVERKLNARETATDGGEAAADGGEPATDGGQPHDGGRTQSEDGRTPSDGSQPTEEGQVDGGGPPADTHREDT